MTLTLIVSALLIGFTHAFEADHLLAVSNIVSSRAKLLKAIKDGLFWGLGHTSSILMISIFFLTLQYQVNEKSFTYFEALVGVMLTGLGIFRLYKLKLNYTLILDSPPVDTAKHPHTHTHLANEPHKTSHLPSYIIGSIHGLAGSGSLMIVVLASVQNTGEGFVYLLCFGIGSIVGMMLAAATFGIPFSQQMFKNKILQASLVIFSSVLSIYFGIKIIAENL